MSYKLLLLDIETAPTLAYVWKLFDENISTDQIVRPSRVICWAAQWHGTRKVEFGSEWGDGRPKMLKRIHGLLNEADAVITYNGDRFDLPKLMGEFAVARLGSPGPVTSIDLYKTVRKLGYQSGKLAFVGPHLEIGEKVKHEGFRLWAQVEAGDEKARRKMERYNKQDTRLLGTLYERLKPYVVNHPYLGLTGKSSCPACGSVKVQRKGTRRTKAFIIERLHCQECGTWSDGTRAKAPG